jgi:tetratricopeptide (TPR) repeat protein
MSSASFIDRMRQALWLHKCGRHFDSEREARALLAFAPDHVDLLTLLAATTQRRGDSAQANDFWTRAANAPGATAIHWNILGLFHRSRGNARDAALAFERATRVDPNYAIAYKNLGQSLQKLGDLNGACAALREAVRLDPNCSEAHCRLGELLRCSGLFEDAVTCFEATLRTNPLSAEAFHGLGMIRHEQGDLAGALEHYRDAIRVRPDCHESSSNIAVVLKELGQFAAAIDQFRKTLAIVPHHSHAIYNLSQLAADGHYEFEPQELAAIEELVATAQGRAVDRSLLCFSIAAVHEAGHRYDEAFAYFRMANDLRKQSIPAGAGFDAVKHREAVERVIRQFDARSFERVRNWGSASETPIFIVGMPRSGSTLVEQILATDPRVFAAGELGEIARRLQRLGGVSNDFDLHASRLPFESPEEAQEFAGSDLHHLDTISRRAPRVTIKTLENVLHLGVIAMAFPAARIIRCVRDSLDVCVSCYFQNFANVDFSWELGDIGRYHQVHEHLVDHWRRVLPMPMHELRYEELILDPEPVTRELFRFCDLEWHASCLRFFENRGPVRTASSVQVRKPLSAKSIGRWQRYRAHLAPLFEALGHPLAGQSFGIDAAMPLGSPQPT